MQQHVGMANVLAIHLVQLRLDEGWGSLLIIILLLLLLLLFRDIG
jgi:hypothetical protein